MSRSYIVGRWLFLRLLGLVYLIAFLSLWVQVQGLVGSDGILPVTDYLHRVEQHLGLERFWQAPTLLWFGSSDLALHLLCGAGVALSVLLLAGVAPLPVLALLWASYLSLSVGGQTFLSFQWDTLLLETGFCALFVAPWRWRPALPWTAHASPPPRRMGLWLLWLLLFKLMFLSGAVKLLSLDETWWQLTALDVHYWTQPLPTAASWYAHPLPGWFQKLSVLITYAIEIALPFLIFAGPRGRRAVAAGTVFLMLMISWTGNYGFFNLLTLVLCVPLVDDAVWARCLPARLQISPTERGSARGRLRRFAFPMAVTVLLALSALTMVQELVRTVPRPMARSDGSDGPDGPGGVRGLLIASAAAADRAVGWSGPMLARVAPFRTLNGYGLFRAMTTERPEIVIEGSRDGAVWKAYEFPWKPGDPSRRPEVVAPHMPRLDWQMWFAALNPRRAGPWLEGLLRGIFEASPPVLSLLAYNPFPDEPPRYLRLVYYQYRFATPTERRQEGVWWTREKVGYLTQPIPREQLVPPTP